jgi:hypothetical protein
MFTKIGLTDAEAAIAAHAGGGSFANDCRTHPEKEYNCVLWQSSSGTRLFLKSSRVIQDWEELYWAYGNDKAFGIAMGDDVRHGEFTKGYKISDKDMVHLAMVLLGNDDDSGFLNPMPSAKVAHTINLMWKKRRLKRRGLRFWCVNSTHLAEGGHWLECIVQSQPLAVRLWDPYPESASLAPAVAGAMQEVVTPPCVFEVAFGAQQAANDGWSCGLHSAWRNMYRIKQGADCSTLAELDTLQDPPPPPPPQWQSLVWALLCSHTTGSPDLVSLWTGLVAGDRTKLEASLKAMLSLVNCTHNSI